MSGRGSSNEDLFWRGGRGRVRGRGRGRVQEISSSDSDEEIVVEELPPVPEPRPGTLRPSFIGLGQPVQSPRRDLVFSPVQHSRPEIPPFNDAMTATQKTEIFYSYGQEIRDAFSAGQQFAIIEGPTGGGKTTVTTLGHCKENINFNTPNFSMFMCEPTRNATSMLYKRLVTLGNSVGLRRSVFGMKIKNESINATTAKFTVGTAGWLNTKLMHDPTYIYKITTLALDEIHTRGMDTETLIGTVSCLQHGHGVTYSFKNMSSLYSASGVPNFSNS